MACEEANSQCQTTWESFEPILWTEDAHSLYLSFLEDAFVNDLYHRHYCSPDICGCSPPLPSTLSPHASTAVAAGESPSSAPSPCPSTGVVPFSEPESKAETKTRRRGPRSTAKVSSSKRKGKWPSQDGGPEPVIRLQDQPGSSFQYVQNSEYVVPKLPQGVSKKLRVKAKMGGTDRLGTDQV